MDFRRKIHCSGITGKTTSDRQHQSSEGKSLSSSATTNKAEKHKGRFRKFANLSLKPKHVQDDLKIDGRDEASKRLAETILETPIVDKKPKVSDSNNSLSTTLQNRNDLYFEDTLDCVESTQVLVDRSKSLKNGNTDSESGIGKSNKTSAMSENSNFDAFKNYFDKHDSYSTSGKASQQLNEDEDKHSHNVSTQFFMDSQVLRQIDSAILDSSKKENSVNEHEKILEQEPESVFKIPEPAVIKKENNENINGNIVPLQKQVEKASSLEELFNKELLTTQCRREVDIIFERLETSIYLMGATNKDDNRILPDQVFDIIFSAENNPEESLGENNVLSQTKKLHEQSIANIDWSNETLLNATGVNSSFGTVFKHALEANATKAATVEKTANKSFTEGDAVFIAAGPFYGLPLKVKELIKHYKGIEELYDWQEECLRLPAIEQRKNLIYALPTSGGKTLVAEILILREILCYKRNALFILPYVAIVQEKVWALSPFAVALDFLVEEYAASKGVYPPRKRRRKNSVYIATIEKALGLINSLIETGRLNELGLIVVDELHLIGEQGRGATLEALLTKLVYLKASVQIIGMSATIGNLEDIQKFLDANVYTQNFRPVELTEFVKCGSQIAKINWNAKSEEDLLTEVKNVDFSYSDAVKKLDPDHLGGLVMEVIPKGSCLIFCSSKKNCENVAYLLCRVIFPNLKEYKKTEKEQLIHALKDESGLLCNILKVSIQYGVAYHHSGLTSEERRIIEDGFRSGVISVICCTSTLAAGVNLPAQRVILRQPYIGREFINLSRYKQMVGRAGRAGLGEAGNSIVICTTQDLPKLKKMLISPMDQALSGMHMFNGKGLCHLLLSCLSLGIATNKVGLINVANRTLMAVQAENLDVTTKKLTEKVIVQLFKMGALQTANMRQSELEDCSQQTDVSVRLDSTGSSLETSTSEDSQNMSKKKKRLLITNNTKLMISKLGSAAIKGGLDLERAHILYDDLVQAQRSLVLLDVLHLLFLVTPYDIAEQIKPNMHIYYTLLSQMNYKETYTAKILGLNESVAVKMLANQPIKNIPERVLNRFYLTMMLNDLWNEKPIFEVSEKYQINRGVVQNLMTSAASFASNVVNFCDELEEFWAFAHLLRGMSQRLSHCCMRELLPLMELPAVKQSRARQLYNAGYKTLQSIAKASANDLVESIEYMSRRVANQLIAASKMLLLEKIENLREEAEDVLDGVENPKSFFNRTVQ